MFQLPPAPDELHSMCGRVRLIPSSPEHHPDLAHLLADPRIWEQGFAPGISQAPQTPEQMDQFLFTRAQVPTLFTVLVDGEIAGTTGIVRVYPKRRAVLMGRTVFGAQFWGLGLNAITKDIVMEWLFTAGVSTVECEVSPTNQRSLSSLTRLGFAEVGTRRRNTPGQRAPWRTLTLLRTAQGSWSPSGLHLR